MRILLVEDDKNLSGSIVEAMRSFNHSAEAVDNGRDALELMAGEEYDALILDLSLPDMEGERVLKRIRQAGGKIPIIILTASQGMSSKLETLNAGADDFLTKPFDVRELELRLRAIVRRSSFQTSSKITVGNFEYDSESRRAYVNGVDLAVPRKELLLLDCLLHRLDQVVSRQTILDRLYSIEEEVDPKVVDLYVHRLRKKLENACSLKIINLKGLGYFLRSSKSE